MNCVTSEPAKAGAASGQASIAAAPVRFAGEYLGAQRAPRAPKHVRNAKRRAPFCAGSSILWSKVLGGILPGGYRTVLGSWVEASGG
jgi:hypothetical protein